MSCREERLGSALVMQPVSLAIDRGFGPAVLRRPSRAPRDVLTVTSGSGKGRRCVLYLEGALHAPIGVELLQNVRALLERGERMIVLDLAKVPRIDAAGVGELVRAYNMTAEAHGVLQILSATAWVRHVLRLTGLFDILSGGALANDVQVAGGLC